MPETEQTELELYIVNDGDLYRQRAQPIIKNLAKKMLKGTYSHIKAAKLWAYLADAGAQKYTKDFDARGASSYGIFSKADRVAVGKSLADNYREEVVEAANLKSNPHRRYKMARRKKSKVRGTVVKFHQGRKVVRVVFRRAKKTPAAKAAAKRRGAKLARKYKLVWKGKAGHKRVFLRVGNRLKKIRQPHR